MKALPHDFAELLSPAGRRILDGRDRERAGALSRGGTRFLAIDDALSKASVRAVLSALEAALPSKLKEMEQPIPPESTWGMTENYAELLPKTSKVKTALLQSARSEAFKAAERVGLVQLLRSESFRQFAQVLNGRPLRKAFGIQLLCYGPGDYAGPHNDHHPEEPEAQDGYLDVHLTFANRWVERQLLVYERRGHFSHVADVAREGLITAYRLPFWHFTTPLEGTQNARRWVLLGTFTDQR